MPKKNRSRLKEYFATGSRPTAGQFEDLVDSMLNIVDDGLDKSDEKGLKLSPAPGEDTVLSLMADPLELPLWEICLTSGNCLGIRRGGETFTALTLHPNRVVELGNKNNPQKVLVHGMIQAQGFVGSNQSVERIPADGQWYDITPATENFCAYRITALLRHLRPGKNILLLSTGTHASGKKHTLSSQECWGNPFWRRIRLRWRREGRRHWLQVRSRRDYGPRAGIHIRIACLMDESNI